MEDKKVKMKLTQREGNKFVFKLSPVAFSSQICVSLQVLFHLLALWSYVQHVDDVNDLAHLKRFDTSRISSHSLLSWARNFGQFSSPRDAPRMSRVTLWPHLAQVLSWNVKWTTWPGSERFRNDYNSVADDFATVTGKSFVLLARSPRLLLVRWSFQEIGFWRLQRLVIGCCSVLRMRLPNVCFSNSLLLVTSIRPSLYSWLLLNQGFIFMSVLIIFQLRLLYNEFSGIYSIWVCSWTIRMTQKFLHKRVPRLDMRPVTIHCSRFTPIV